MRVITQKRRNVQKLAGNPAILSAGNGNILASGQKAHEQAQILTEASRQHPWTYATMDAISRSAIGAGWSIVPVEAHKDKATKLSRKKLENFLENSNRTWNTIKDYQSFPDKLKQTINSYTLLGQAAWEIVKDHNGTPVGFDVLSGIMIPNTDEKGYFMEPNFRFFPWDRTTPVDFNKDEIIFFYSGGITGRVTGESVYESLLNTALPADLFASVSYRSLFENVNSPYNGFWVVDPNTTDDDYEMIVGLLEDRYSSPLNYGRNPLAIRGGLDFKPIVSRSKEDAPYLEGRHYNREEFLGVTGVDGNKLGITESSNKANMRETRREFHENTLRPLFRKIEDDIYHQVCVKALGIKGWKFEFKMPDITTAVEQMTIDMRALQWGILSPNEVRATRGLDPRAGGDIYYLPLNLAITDKSGDTHDVSEGTDENNPVNTDTGERPDENSTEENPEPDTEEVRQPADERSSSKSGRIRELKTWKKNHLRYLDGKRDTDRFETEQISPERTLAIRNLLNEARDDFYVVKRIFEIAIELEEEENE